MRHEDPHGPGLGSRLVTGLIYARALWPEELPESFVCPVGVGRGVLAPEELWLCVWRPVAPG